MFHSVYNHDISQKNNAYKNISCTRNIVL